MTHSLVCPVGCSNNLWGFLLRVKVMEKLKIEYLPITELKPYDNNAKIHTPEQIEQIKTSIEMFGFNDPIGIWGGANEIVEGHGRLMAAKDLGFDEVPVIRLDELTDEERRAYMLAHNQLTMNTGFDFELLEIELENLEIDMEQFGFETIATDEEEVVEVDVPEPPEEPKSKMGEIYKLGEHILMCGDSTSPEDVGALMGCGDAVEADMVFTDPPYGVSYKGTNNPNGREWEIIENDTLRGDELYQFLLEAFKNIKRYLKVGGAFYIWYANSNAMQFESALQDAELRKKQTIIWSKGMVLGHSDYHWAYEPCLYGCHPEMNSAWFGDRTQKTVWDLSKKEIRDMKKDELVAILLKLNQEKDIWEIKRDSVNDYLHPTQKPVGLSAKALHNSSQRGNVVLDLFGGSGSTLMACEQLGRQCRMMEYDPKYVDVIIERWETFTGKKAEKIN